MGAGDIAGSILFCCCGPKGSIFCLALSLWGFIMLALLGGFYWIEAVALFDDIVGGAAHHEGKPGTEFPLPITYYNQSTVTSAYRAAAKSCFGAAVIYLFFLVFSGSFVLINMWRSKIKKQK